MGTCFALNEDEVSYIRSMCQQFVVEFGRMSVNTDGLLGEASRDARLLADSKRIPVRWKI